MGEISHQNLPPITEWSFIVRVRFTLLPTTLCGNLKSRVSRPMTTTEAVYLKTKKSMILFDQQVDRFINFSSLLHQSYYLTLMVVAKSHFLSQHLKLLT